MVTPVAQVVCSLSLLLDDFWLPIPSQTQPVSSLSGRAWWMSCCSDRLGPCSEITRPFSYHQSRRRGKWVESGWTVLVPSEVCHAFHPSSNFPELRARSLSW